MNYDERGVQQDYYVQAFLDYSESTMKHVDRANMRGQTTECGKCGLVFTDENLDELRDHVLTHVKASVITSCPKCGDDTSQLKQHWRKKHRDLPPPRHPTLTKEHALEAVEALIDCFPQFFLNQPQQQHTIDEDESPFESTEEITDLFEPDEESPFEPEQDWDRGVCTFEMEAMMYAAEQHSFYQLEMGKQVALLIGQGTEVCCFMCGVEINPESATEELEWHTMEHLRGHAPLPYRCPICERLVPHIRQHFSEDHAGTSWDEAQGKIHVRAKVANDALLMLFHCFPSLLDILDIRYPKPPRPQSPAVTIEPYVQELSTRLQRCTRTSFSDSGSDIVEVPKTELEISENLESDDISLDLDAESEFSFNSEHSSDIDLSSDTMADHIEMVPTRAPKRHSFPQSPPHNDRLAKEPKKPKPQVRKPTPAPGKPKQRVPFRLIPIEVPEYPFKTKAKEERISTDCETNAAEIEKREEAATITPPKHQQTKNSFPELKKTPAVTKRPMRKAETEKIVKLPKQVERKRRKSARIPSKKLIKQLSENRSFEDFASIPSSPASGESKTPRTQDFFQQINRIVSEAKEVGFVICQMNNCDVKITSPDAGKIQRHLAGNHGIKPNYNCEECSKKFSTASGFRNHGKGGHRVPPKEVGTLAIENGSELVQVLNSCFA